MWAPEPQHSQHRQLREPDHLLQRTIVMTVAMASYHYDTLPNDSFRLLNNIDTNGPTVKCTLSTYSLDNHPDYLALSYTWGSAAPGDGMTQERDCSLQCNGSRVLITANLEHALRSLPLSNKHIWADAVCINQDRNDERSTQVTLMGRIYSQACQVIVWLGNEDDSVKTAFDFIRDFGSRLPRELDFSNRKISDAFFSGPEAWTRIGRHAWSVVERHALIYLFLRNWFSRTWVIQEVVLASNTMVFCGPYSVPWWPLCMVSAFASNQNLVRNAKEEVEGARELLTTRDGSLRLLGNLPDDAVFFEQRCKATVSGMTDANRDQKLASVLGTMMVTVRDLEATEPRDKVFAPVALLLHFLGHEELPDRLRPDYDKSVAHVFTEITSYILQNCDECNRECIILMVGNTTQSQVEGLPSWVPDYTTPVPPFLRYFFGTRINCLAGLRLELDKNLEFAPKGSTLRLSTSRFDTISVPLPPFSKIIKGSVAGLLTWLQFSTALPDFDASGEPAIISMIHALTLNVSRGWVGYDYTEVYEKFREILIRVFCHIVGRSQISVDELLDPKSILGGLLDDLERRQLTAFPTRAQLRSVLEDPRALRSALENSPVDLQHAASEIQAFELMKYDDWRLFQSAKGYLGMVRVTAETGDGIFFVPDAAIPFVLRKANQSGEYRFVGDAYVHGIMNGELWREGLRPQWSSISLI